MRVWQARKYQLLISNGLLWSIHPGYRTRISLVKEGTNFTMKSGTSFNHKSDNPHIHYRSFMTKEQNSLHRKTFV